MKLYEAIDIIERTPYVFTEEDIHEFEFKVTDRIFDRKRWVERTLAAVYIEKWKTLPQKELLYDSSITVDGDTLAMFWVRQCKTFPPKELYHDPLLKNEFYGLTVEMLCIVCIGKLPPIEWMHDKNITSDSEAGLTCEMLWIICTKNPNIPKEILHDPSMHTYNGDTCAMIWIDVIKSLPPSELIHNPHLKNDRHETCATIWKKRCQTPVPKCIDDGNT